MLVAIAATYSRCRAVACCAAPGPRTTLRCSCGFALDVVPGIPRPSHQPRLRHRARGVLREREVRLGRVSCTSTAGVRRRVMQRRPRHGADSQRTLGAAARQTAVTCGAADGTMALWSVGGADVSGMEVRIRICHVVVGSAERGRSRTFICCRRRASCRDSRFSPRPTRSQRHGPSQRRRVLHPPPVLTIPTAVVEIVAYKEPWRWAERDRSHGGSGGRCRRGLTDG